MTGITSLYILGKLDDPDGDPDLPQRLRVISYLIFQCLSRLLQKGPKHSGQKLAQPLTDLCCDGLQDRCHTIIQARTILHSRRDQQTDCQSKTDQWVGHSLICSTVARMVVVSRIFRGLV